MTRLTLYEMKVYQCLKDNPGSDFHFVAKKTRKPLTQAQAYLARLVLKGVIEMTCDILNDRRVYSVIPDVKVEYLKHYGVKEKNRFKAIEDVKTAGQVHRAVFMDTEKFSGVL